MPRLQSPMRFRVLIMERVNDLINKEHTIVEFQQNTLNRRYCCQLVSFIFGLRIFYLSGFCLWWLFVFVSLPKHLLFLSSSFQLVPSFRFKAIRALAQTRRMLDMGSYDIDSDVKRWGLHLLDVCTYANDSSQSIVTQFEYDPSLNQVGYVREGYFQPSNVENDEAIAQAFQEELSKVHSVDAAEWSRTGEEHVQASVLAQDWRGSSKRHSNYDEGSDQACLKSEEEEDLSKRLNNEMGISCSYPHAEKASYSEEECSNSLEIMDQSSLDGEVGKRLNQMFPIPHVPKTIEKLPSADEEISDHERLLERLQLYDLVEQKVDGDGNCQFSALSDQLYRSPEHHDFVRQQIVGQLNTFQDIYEGYVSMPYDEYLQKMSKKGEWGDHVTLQAAADWFGVKIFVITSFKDTCYIEILPYIEKSNRVICLSFWAEVHYNSIYPEGELPASCSKKKKKWWNF